MANWSLPVLTDLYTNVLSYLKDRDVDIARWFSTKYAAATNIVDGVVRWNNTNKNWEIWNGTTSTWGVLATKYMVDVDSVDGAHVGTAANNALKLDASGLVPLANIPATLTGKNADTLDGAHAATAATAGYIPIRDASGNIAGNILGNAATCTTATNSDKLDGYHASTTAAASYIPVRDASGNIAGNILGNAATATTLATTRKINGVSFNGSADITLTAAPSAHTHVGTDVTSAVANATNGRNVYNNGAYGGTTGYIEPSSLYVAYANSAGNANTVGGEAVTTLAQHRAEGRNYIDYSRYVYDNGAGGGTVGWKEPTSLKITSAKSADNALACSGNSATATNSTYSTNASKISVSGTYRNLSIVSVAATSWDGAYFRASVSAGGTVIAAWVVPNTIDAGNGLWPAQAYWSGSTVSVASKSSGTYSVVVVTA